VGIVYISHKMDEIQRIADRITVMRDGCTVGTVPAATPMPDIIAMMVGRRLEPVRKVIPDTSAEPVLLEVRGLNRGRQVRDVSFHVRRGEIVGFAGLMGAGRTEVMRAIFGADRPQAGEVRVAGRPVAIRSPADAVAAGIGYLSEDRKQFGLATGMSVEANITLPSLARWLKARFFIDRAGSEAIAREMVERLRVRTPSIHQLARLLSGGNQQKVVIAKWLVRDCEILIFDEPTRGIDVGAKAEIYRLLNDLAAQGRAIVVISSELPEVLQLAHRILVMCEGRITGEVGGAEATQEGLMALATTRDTAPVAA
jgi:ribose transport system ATP-binding protein